ncbi:MAG: 30S ribosomal protein S2 [Pseudomonadota bacterium]
MSLPEFSMRQLLEAGVHFGHQTHRWNPKMEQFIFGSRNGVHILDLAQTVPLLHQALVAVRDAVAGGGRLLFVGTKRAASDPIADAARRSAQYYMNHRWLGGTLTNWQTISNSIKRLKKLQETLSQDNQPFTKKELLGLTRERDKLEQALGGIQDMSGLPDLMFVIDTNKEAIAIQEARKLGIPVVAVLDSNCDPEGIDYPIPGNDDAGRAVALYCDLMARAAIEGISESQISRGVDIGEATEPMAEPALESETSGDADAVESGEEANGEDLTFKGLDAPEGEADDLTQISGIGEGLQEKLHGMGIYHFRQIAAFNPDEIAAVDATLNFKGRIERDGWLEQAAKLAEG